MRLFIKGIVRSAVVLACLFTINLAHALHVDTAFAGDKAYFLFSAPNKIAVYNMATQSHETDISLSKIPTAFAIKDNTAYIAYHRELRALDLTNGNNEFIRNASNDITRIVLQGDYLYAMENTGSIHVIKRNGFALVETEPSNYYSSGSSLVSSPINQAIYTRSAGISPSDISVMTIAANGGIDSITDSPYHGDYPNASRLFLNSSESKVYDDAGIIYFAADLTYAGSLAGALKDLTFSGDNPIVLRDKLLTLLNSADIEQGVIELTSAPDRIVAYGEQVFAFTLSASGVTASAIDISGFDLPAPGEPVNPNGLAYTPDFTLHDNQDVVYLIDRETLSVFRWSIAAGEYLTSWSLLSPPTWATYSAAHQRLYFGFANGKISYLDTSTETPVETHFTSLPTRVSGLIAAGNYLFAADQSGAWATHYSFSASGTKLSSFEWSYLGHEYAWNPITKRIYSHRDDTSPNDLVWRELDPDTGLLGDDSDSPYHGDTLITSYPLVVSHDGEYILNGAGQILNAYTGSVLNALSNSITAGVWLEDQLVTVKDGNTLQLWQSNFALGSEYFLADAVSSQLFNMNEHLVIVKQAQAHPVIVAYDLDNMPDSDGDGIHDLKDNCLAIANASQDDYDSDGIGDVCDSDDDNDGLTDEVELAFGLNPKNASDADGDLDSDGFSNRIEIMLNSDPKNAASVPTAISFYQENFENGWPAGFYLTDGKLPWKVQQSGTGHVLQSTSFSSIDQSSEVSFTSRFNAGVLSFEYKSNNNNGYSYNQRLEILVDGAIKESLYSYYDTSSRMNIVLSEGVHTITFRVKADYWWGNETPVTFSIDNLIFDQDTDNDGILNSLDNCPNHYNYWQTDSDNDGIGDECDNDPYGQDADGDGWGDDRDNCPNVPNPDQSDVDNDYIGDACDPTDDRPADTDGDGIYDHWDNCPTVFNPNQNDLDWDWIGDACDDDVDGDGVKGVDEAKYSFMSDTNPTDAALDQDGDGVSNAMEINSGYNPGVADNHPQVDLFDYYLLGDLTYTYVDDDQNRYITRFRKTDKANQFEIKMDFSTGILERRSDGIYLLSEKTSDLTWEYTNYLIVPKSLKLGQSVSRSVNYKVISNYDSSTETGAFNQKIQLIETGKRDWKGRTYDSVVVEFTITEPGFQPFTYYATYLKNLGSIGEEYAWLESANLTSIDKGNSSTDGNTGNGGDKKGGGGGSSNIWLLFILLTCAAYSYRRQLR
jgi:hypothetical protein